MTFGRVPLADAAGTILAHALYPGGRLFKKGRVLDRADLELLAAAGHTDVAVVRLDGEDLSEDEAALAVAASLAGAQVRWTPAGLGRANLVATTSGLFTIDRDAVDRLNGTDERVTLATLAIGTRVVPGSLVATVKVIPFALPRALVSRVAQPFVDHPAARAVVHPWCGLRAGLVLTRFPRTGAGGLDKAAAIQRHRLARIGGFLVAERRVSHEESAVVAALDELLKLGASPLLVLGASATADRGDVLPEAIQRLGGTVERLGLPVDPGNLLLLGRIGSVPVIGVPACARAPRRSGFDAVLERLAAGLPVEASELSTWGVGGLLAEAPRPAPRRAREQSLVAAVAAVVLAAGGSTRMAGNGHKLTAVLAGRPLVTHAVDAVLASRARPVVVVLGHQAAAVAIALGERDVQRVDNPTWGSGLAGSLAAGLAALPGDVVGALVCLGDMPRVRPATLDALLDAFDGPDSIVVPSHGGRRGNPVLFGRRYFAEMAELEGDVGARALLERHAEAVKTLAVDDPGILLDVDTPAQLEELSAEP